MGNTSRKVVCEEEVEEVEEGCGNEGKVKTETKRERGREQPKKKNVDGKEGGGEIKK